MLKLVQIILKIWFHLPQKLRFILVGGWNTAFGYGLFVILYYYFSLSLSKTIILLLAFIIGTLQNLVTYKVFVFQSKGNWALQAIKNYLIAIIFYFINLGLLFLLVDYYHISIYIAQFFITITLPVLLYIVLRYFVFLHR